MTSRPTGEVVQRLVAQSTSFHDFNYSSYDSNAAMERQGLVGLSATLVGKTGRQI
ncbi:hypothetical protein [Tistrella mobilis]|uniref:hypothetical protein n=1 Tax=Tistrella mobilis TaxID=171437 RepID=UPI003556ECAE